MLNEEVAAKVCTDALHKAYQVHEALGASGEEVIRENQYAEGALRVDVEIEAAIIQYFDESGLPIRIVSEEHGTVDLNTSPQYLAILDGLDGSSVYKASRGIGRYGTMLGLYTGSNPKYGDYLFGGIMEHSANRLLTGVRNKGCWCVEGGREYPIVVSTEMALNHDTKIQIDEYWEFNRQFFSAPLSAYNTSSPISSAMHYADLASGEADIVCECTRKGNLEIGVAYGLVTEAGGGIYTASGESIEGKHFLQFSQETQMPIISGATESLVVAMIDLLESYQPAE